MSQGPSGAAEYVELLTVGTPDCNNSCMDLRGWIIDDNNGTFESGTGTGIAPGAMRFDPNNNFWECVPYGTLIVIYNQSDRNSAIPPDDASLSDGNCLLILPGNSPLLQGHSSQPVANGAMTYATTGWGTASWTNISMSNGQDSFQTIDPSNTTSPAHSVSWGSNNNNTIIYFSGSASGDVMYFNNSISDDPSVQGNYTLGSASTDQTPGAANNADNGAFINSLNNNCSPFSSVISDAGTNGTVDICASGTPLNLFDELGATPETGGTWAGPSTLTNGDLGTFDPSSMNAGTYTYTVGTAPCDSSATVTVTFTTAPNPGTNGTLDACVGTGTADLFDYLNGSPDNTGSWSGPSATSGGNLGTIDLSSASAGTYTYTVGTAPCDASAEVVLTFTTNGDPGANSSVTVCISDPTLNLFDELGGSPDAGGTWSGPSAVTNGDQGTLDPSTSLSGTYEYTITGTGVCPDVSAEVVVDIEPVPQIDPLADVIVCSGYALPTITGSNLSGNETYYDGPNASGNSYSVGQVINTDMTLYAYDEHSTLGCSDEVSFTITIDGPTIDLGNDTTFCDGSSITLDAGAGFDSYLWQDGSTNQTFTASSSGTYFVEASNLSQNLVVNGDFEQGDNFFSSQYTYGTGGAWGLLSNPSTYAVDTSPNNVHNNFMPCTDHSGTGNAMIVNGSDVANTSVWCQTIQVTPNTDYSFAAWVSSVENTTNVAQLQFSINGSPLGAIFSPTTTGCDWNQFSETWNSGAQTSIDICIVNQNTSQGGNDFMLDDIYFAEQCIAYDTIEITVEPLPNAGIDNQVNLCNGAGNTNLFDAIGGTPDTGGVWEGPSSLTGADLGTFNTQSNAAGQYEYIVEGVTCPNDTSIVEVIIGAGANGGTDSTIILCYDGAPVDLFVNLGGTPDVGGSWSPQTASGNNMFDPAVDQPEDFVYTVSGFGGCPDSSATVTVVVSPDAGSNNTITLCSTADIEEFFSYLGADADSLGTWSGPSALGAGYLGEFDPGSMQGGTYNYSFPAIGNCPAVSSAIDVTIENQANPGLSNSITLCESDASIDLFDELGSSAEPGGVWNPLPMSGNAIFDPAVDAGGDYRYVVSGGVVCPDTFAIVTVTVSPDVYPVIDPVSDLCVNGVAEILTATPQGGSWSSNCGTCLDANQNFSPATSGVGIFEVYYELTTQCGQSDTLEITVNDIPSLSILVSDTLRCSPFSFDFSDDNAQAGNTYNWMLDGTSISTNTSGTAVISNNGCQELSVEVTDAGGCSSITTYPTLICAEPYPTAYFEYLPETPTTYDYLVDVTNLSSDANAYEWTMNGVPFGSDEDLSIDFGGYEPAGYYLCLTATNYLGCADTYCDTIHFEDEFSLFVPNTFTPNGNGQNETFGAVYSGEHPEDVSFYIFDRWGELIFEASDLNTYWDGTHFGQPVKQDAYVWKIKYKLPGSPERYTKIGHVSLIR